MKPSELEQYAKSEMYRHGLIQKGWRFRWDRAKARFGYCNETKKIISVSIHMAMINPAAETVDTILHEIAHALAGCENGHNFYWKQQARALGCSATRCYDKSVNVAMPNYIIRCPNCGKTQDGFRRPRRRQACGECCRNYNGGRFTEKFLLTYEKI